MRKYWIPSLIFILAAVTPDLSARVPTLALPPDQRPAPPASTAAQPLLPQSFAGWEAPDGSKPFTDPAQADQANAAALKEYGFSDGLANTYTRDGEKLTIKALRFVDGSGAYGAYSYYRQSNWPKEEVGTGGASFHNRVMFWVGNIVIDAQFPHISAMSGSELRELAATLPVPAGNKALAPPILSNLPHTDPSMRPDGQSTHYALGPASYTGSGGVLPANLVGFDHGAETATATYKLRSGPATLTVINYPTPQMAASEEKAISAYIKSGVPPGGTQDHLSKALQESNPASIEVRRSGPLVAIVSGDAITDEAHKLVTSVHYQADTANLPGTGSNEAQKTAQLIIGIITLVVVMFCAALGVALFLGGGRAAYRFARGKPLSSMHDAEFTSLDLRE